jgi:Ribosomal protein L7Ae/L30e/S12e/Gadd45 family
MVTCLNSASFHMPPISELFVKSMLCLYVGGLDEALNNIIEMSRQQNVPFVFALGRRALGRVCAKLVPVSIVGIFCYEGTEVSILCSAICN